MPEPIAVICGATAGVGRATAEAFATAGYRVALIARGEQGLRDIPGLDLDSLPPAKTPDGRDAWDMTKE